MTTDHFMGDGCPRFAPCIWAPTWELTAAPAHMLLLSTNHYPLLYGTYLAYLRKIPEAF